MKTQIKVKIKAKGGPKLLDKLSSVLGRPSLKALDQ